MYRGFAKANLSSVLSFACLHLGANASLSLPAHSQPKQVVILIYMHIVFLSFPRQIHHCNLSLTGPRASILIPYLCLFKALCKWSRKRQQPRPVLQTEKGIISHFEPARMTHMQPIKVYCCSQQGTYFLPCLYLHILVI